MALLGKVFSQRKAIKAERSFRSILERRPFGIIPVLLFAQVCVFSIGVTLSAAKVRFPFYPLFMGVFSLLILATAVHWILQSVVYVKKKEWSGYLFLAFSGSVAYFGARLLWTAITGPAS